jgi:hypothetical protein
MISTLLHAVFVLPDLDCVEIVRESSLLLLLERVSPRVNRSGCSVWHVVNTGDRVLVRNHSDRTRSEVSRSLEDAFAYTYSSMMRDDTRSLDG